MTDSIKHSAGHVFPGPDGQGYALRRDVHVGDGIASSAFEAFGGAPSPVYGQKMPDWLKSQIAPQ